MPSDKDAETFPKLSEEEAKLLIKAIEEVEKEEAEQQEQQSKSA